MSASDLLAYANRLATTGNRLVSIDVPEFEGIEPLTDRRLILVCVSSRGVSVNTIAELLYLGCSYGKPLRLVTAKRETTASKLLTIAKSELITTGSSGAIAVIHYGLTCLVADEQKPSYPTFWQGMELLHATVAAAILRGENPTIAADIEMGRFYGRRDVSRQTYKPKEALQAQVRQYLGSGYLEKAVQFTLHPGLQRELNLLKNGERIERINEMNDILCQRYGCC